jgi:hypothetical protein
VRAGGQGVAEGAGNHAASNEECQRRKNQMLQPTSPLRSEAASYISPYAPIIVGARESAVVYTPSRNICK